MIVERMWSIDDRLKLGRVQMPQRILQRVCCLLELLLVGGERRVSAGPGPLERLRVQRQQRGQRDLLAREQLLLLGGLRGLRLLLQLLLLRLRGLRRLRPYLLECGRRAHLLRERVVGLRRRGPKTLPRIRICHHHPRRHDLHYICLPRNGLRILRKWIRICFCKLFYHTRPKLFTRCTYNIKTHKIIL